MAWMINSSWYLKLRWNEWGADQGWDGQGDVTLVAHLLSDGSCGREWEPEGKERASERVPKTRDV